MPHFKNSLRLAFDAIANQFTELFTLWLQPCPDATPFKVDDTTQVTYALGYCLSRETRYRLATQNRSQFTPIALGDGDQGVEVVFRPKPDTNSILRTQSHIFTQTRLSGIARNYKEYVKIVPPAYYGYVDALERLIWQISEDKSHIFMMPLVNYGFEPTHTPTVAALCYTRVSDDEAKDMLRLATQRQSASIKFHRTMYISCCDAVARILATGLIEDEQLDGLNARVNTLIQTYAERLTVTVTVHDQADEQTSLLNKLQLLHDYRLGHSATLEPWQSIHNELARQMPADSDTAIRLDKLSITCKPDSFELDLLVGIFDILLSSLSSPWKKSIR